MRLSSLIASAALMLLTVVAAPAAAEAAPPPAASTSAAPSVPAAPTTKAPTTTAPTTKAPTTKAPPPAPASSGTAAPQTTKPKPTGTPTTSGEADTEVVKPQAKTQSQFGATSVAVNHDPYGWVSFTSTRSGIAFKGYALDPSDFNAPVTAMFTVNGAVASYSVANQYSPELYAYGVGAPSGLSGTIGTSATSGTVNVCMFVFNVGPGSHQLAQCTNVRITAFNPAGGVSAKFETNGNISVSAYAYDLDSPSSSLGIWIVDNGKLKVARMADDPNPSLVPYGIGGNHGANLSYFAAPGNHDICIYAINVGAGENEWLGCSSVKVSPNAAYHNPRGAFQVVSTQGQINVVGWAYDGSDLNQSVTAMWTVDGAVVGYSVANLASDYLDLPGQHATVAGLPAGPGKHSVCMFVGNIGAGSSQLVQCSDVTVASSWVLPVENSVYTSCYCARWGTFHNGIDLAAPTGRPIKASFDGVVTSAGPVNGYGNLIVIKHPDTGIYTAYAHMYTVGVYVGQYVKAGQQIAPVGAYGNVTGPHLHMETWWGPKLYQSRVDPAQWLAQQGVKLPPYAN